MNIHYNVNTGQIMAYGWGEYRDGFDETSHFPDCKVVLIDDQVIDPQTQKFDPVTFKLVPKDQPAAPDDSFLRNIIRKELVESDKFMMPDYPITEEERASWTTYRQELRDASKGKDSYQAFLDAVPLRPDGSDPVKELKTGE